ncbi:MAG: hypothetical protein WCX65_01175 [bacterium]
MKKVNCKEITAAAPGGAALERALKYASQGVETALFADTPAGILSCPAGIRRIYFGCEFDERNIPSARKAAAAIEASAGRKLKFTLATPIMTDAGTARLKRLLRALSEYAPFEAVANDFGAIAIIRDAGLIPVAGRLLIKQKSDPRLAALKSPRLRNYFKKSAADNAEFAALLRDLGIKRVELDNPLCGLAPPAGFSVSLYYPFVFMTLSMRQTESEHDGAVYFLKNKAFPVDIILSGAAQFYMNQELKALKAGGVNRLVIQPLPPR